MVHWEQIRKDGFCSLRADERVEWTVYPNHPKWSKRAFNVTGPGGKQVEGQGLLDEAHKLEFKDGKLWKSTTQKSQRKWD